MASYTGGQHVYGVQDIITGHQKGIRVARMSPHMNQSQDITTELQEVWTTLNNQEKIAIEAVRAVTLRATSREWVVHAKWVGI